MECQTTGGSTYWIRNGSAKRVNGAYRVRNLAPGGGWGQTYGPCDDVPTQAFLLAEPPKDASYLPEVACPKQIYVVEEMI
jgi:hypothetical protein